MNFDEGEWLADQTAEHVMGWIYDHSDKGWRHGSSSGEPPATYARWEQDWLPHIEHHDAWMVVKRMQALGWHYNMFNTTTGRHVCEFSRDPVGTDGIVFGKVGDTITEAICRAALFAVMTGQP